MPMFFIGVHLADIQILFFPLTDLPMNSGIFVIIQPLLYFSPRLWSTKEASQHQIQMNNKL